MVALTHVPSPRMAECELTHVGRTPIDVALALRQHGEYCRMLSECGAEVITLDVNRDVPDCAFIEDTAVVLDEVAVLASMGAPSRFGEPAGIEEELRKHYPIRRVDPPATLEGGDVLRIGRRLLVGTSSRTNAAGAAALAGIAQPYGYQVTSVPVRGCLHLKTACTALDEATLIVNPAWVDTEALADYRRIVVPASEPWAANVALVGRSVCLAAGRPRAEEMIHRLGHDVRCVDLSEFAKAEGGVTCLSILW